MAVSPPVQSKEAAAWSIGGNLTVTFDSTPTSGNTLVAFLFSEGGGDPQVISSGWTLRATADIGTSYAVMRCYTKLAGASEPTSVVTNAVAGGQVHWMVLYEIDGTYDTGVVGAKSSQPRTSPLTATALSPTVDPGIILAAFYGQTKTYTGPAVWTPTAPLVLGHEDSRPLSRAEAWTGYMPTTTGTYTPTIAQSGLDDNLTMSIDIAFAGVSTDPPVAEFDYDVGTGFEPLTVNFTDLSTNTPTSWSWDFGDGGSSTSQNPTHVFTLPGSFSVTLTATNAFGSDSVSHTIVVILDVGYESPPPANAILEIYASDPSGPRWDEANWDEAVWSEGGWQDVTPEGVTVQILWGSQEPEKGILHRADADSWAVTFYDPDRLLDPANGDSPYVNDLIPFLPVRVSHRGTVIALGYAESIGHNYTLTGLNGYMRVTNNLSRLANAMVPNDTSLSDTLYARAADAIAAAGLSVTVGSPLGSDPPLFPWGDLDPVPSWSAWQWIVDAAEQVNYIAIVNRRTGIVEFRPWASPLNRARSVNSPNLIDLKNISEYRGLYSVVTVPDGLTTVERAITPPPRYGRRTYARTAEVADPDTWADNVLADRALPGLRWIPGEVYPLTADDVEDFATIDAVELVSIAVTEQDPPVAATVIIVGGEINIHGKFASEAVWSFNFQAAQTATEPLIETGGGPTDYLLATGGGEFLYPST